MIGVYFLKSDMASACVCTLRIVMADRILHPTNTFITVNLYICVRVLSVTLTVSVESLCHVMLQGLYAVWHVCEAEYVYLMVASCQWVLIMSRGRRVVGSPSQQTIGAANLITHLMCPVLIALPLPCDVSGTAVRGGGGYKTLLLHCSAGLSGHQCSSPCHHHV